MKEKYKSPRRTEGQKEWAERYNIAIPNVFVNINKISHQKGRNTLFRFFSRTLPGINYERNTTCKICDIHFSDPYNHLFFQCKEIKSKEKTIISTINKLSFIKIQRWSIETLDISRYNRTEKVFPNLIGIVIHQIWKIICFKLFNEDENKLEPKFELQIIESELSNLIEIEKFITLKKIKHEEAILRNTNQDLFKYKFNKSWQTPVNPNPLPIHNCQSLIDISRNELYTYNKYFRDGNCFFHVDVLSSDEIVIVEAAGYFIDGWERNEQIRNSSHIIYTLDIQTLRGQYPVTIGNSFINITVNLNCHVVNSNVDMASLPNYYSKRLPLAPYNMFVFKDLKYYLQYFPVSDSYIAPISFNSFPIDGYFYGDGFLIELELFENDTSSVIIEYNITTNLEYVKFNFSYITNKYPNVPSEEEIFEIGYRYTPFVTITIETTNGIDPVIVFITSADGIRPTPIYSNLTHTTYLANINFDNGGDTTYEAYIINGEDYISLVNDSVRINEKKINGISFTGTYDNLLPTLADNQIFTSGINATSQFDFSDYKYVVQSFSEYTAQLSWPFGFEKGSNGQFQLKFSFLLPSISNSYSIFYLYVLQNETVQYSQLINTNSGPSSDLVLESFESIWLYEFKMLFRFGFNSSIQIGGIQIDNKFYRQENLVLSTYVPPPATEPPVSVAFKKLGASKNDMVFYEILLDTVFYYPNNFLVYDTLGNLYRYYINDYININPISKIEVPKILKDVDIYSVSNIEYLYNDVDITNNSISNIMYFNFSNQNVEPNRPMALVLLDRVSSNNLKNTDDGDDLIGTSKLYYSKWNSKKKMFEIEFTIPANTQSGIVPWFITFSSEYLINEASARRPVLLYSPIFSESNNLDRTRLYSSFLKTSDQLYVKTDNFDAYGPIFSNITAIVGNDYIGWILRISDPINGFSYGDITVRGEQDSSIYKFHLTPSDALRNGDKWNSDYEIRINLNSNLCISQTYIITNVKLFDTQRNRASFSVSGSIVEPLENPFINFLDNQNINKVTYSCISPLSDTTGPELYSFDVYPGSIFEFYFSAIDMESGLKPYQTPVVYLSTIELQTLQCVSKISFINETFANYSCSIDIPNGFGFVPNGEYIVSVYGFINNAGYYSGYSTEALFSLGYGCIFEKNQIEQRFSITGVSSFKENDTELWIFGGEFNDPTISYQNVLIVFSNGSTQDLQVTNSYSSALSISGIKQTSDPFTIQVQFYDQYDDLVNETNIYTVEPIKFNFVQPKSIPIPNNPTVECKGSPVCGGEKNGYCSNSVGCICYSPWVGLDCSSKVIIIPNPTPNESEPTSEIPILKNENNNNNNNNVEDYLYRSLISVVALRELDFNLNVINNYTFDKWNVTKINSNTNQYITDIIVAPSIPSNNQETTTTINVTLQWFENEKDITFANQKLNMKPSSIKYTIEISNYQFRNRLNQIQLILSASFQSSNTDGICSKKDFGETTSTDNSNYMKIQVGDHSLYGRFIKRAIVDNIVRSVQNEIINETALHNYKTLTERSGSSDYSFIGITMPYYRENIVLDPDFSVLLDSSPVSKSDKSSICNDGADGSSKSGLSKGQLAGVIVGAVGFATVIVVSVVYHFWKKKKDAKFKNQMQNKLKEIN
ncbi:hypothetical protein ACTA71_002158 [Dictyostelium dimigraforme]